MAYAIEAALRALNGDLALLVPTMILVVAIIALVILDYRHLVMRYPQGGGASAAVGEAFGDRWSFIPIGALVVDFVLTIAISVSAGASAAIAYFPVLAPWRLLLALALVVLVGAGTWFGHLGRLVFAAMTVAFIIVSAVVLFYGLGATPQPVGTITDTPDTPPSSRWSWPSPWPWPWPPAWKPRPPRLPSWASWTTPAGAASGG